MNKQTFLDSFGHIADAPGGIDKLQRLVLDLATRGRLTKQREDDEPASELVKRIHDERERMVTAKKIRKPKPLLPIDGSVPFELPDGWEWVRLGDIITVNPDGSTGASGLSGDTWVLDLEDIEKGTGVLLQRLTLDERAIHSSKAVFQSGDVLYGKLRPYLNKVVAADKAGICTTEILVLRPGAGTSPEYLCRVLRSPLFHDYTSAKVYGTKMPRLGTDDARKAFIPLPPVAEQGRIVERIADLIGLCDELKEQQTARAEARSPLAAATLHRVMEADLAIDLRANVGDFADHIDLHLAPGEGDLATLKRIRTAILDLAVRGRLTHRDPDDMPATELLKRIAVARDQLVKAKKVRKPKKFAPEAPSEGRAALPKGWTWARADEFFIASDSGWSPRCLVEQAGPGEWGVLKTSAVSRGVFDKVANKKLPQALQPRPQLEVQPGEFVMIRASGSKGLVGRGAIVTETESHLMLSDKHIRLSFLSEASTRYWAILNDSTEVQRYYAAESSGTSTMSNVTRDRIGALTVPVPPLDEQVRIAETVDALFALCDELEKQLMVAKTLSRDLGSSVVANATSADGGAQRREGLRDLPNC
ncbi:restriction endonuclease subunit S [Rhodococcus qingshengii]|uniref:restriction endonuclease subunit S n=1 Tax=Rhodococcus qingshengii TaxID=334542 RepID=UPI0036DD1947